jgi:outer membrane receptor protein involved in Fe transport
MSYSIAASVMAEQFGRKGASDEQAFDPAGQPVQARHADGIEDGRLTLFNLAPRLNWTLENGDTLSSQSFVNSARFRNHNQDVNTTSLGPPAPYPVLDSAVRSDNGVVRTELNWVHKMADGAKLDVKASVVRGRNTTDNRRWTPPAAAGPVNNAVDNLVHLEAGERGTTKVGKFSKAIMQDHALGMGWDGGYSVRADSREEFEAGNRVFPALPKGEESESRVARLALYAQDEWNLAPRWSLYLGARREGIRTTTSGNTFGTGRSRSSVWSPVLQTLWKIPETKATRSASP